MTDFLDHAEQDLQDLLHDHAVAVSRHDATPLTSTELVHHLRGRSRCP
jgi:hypothetical protein